MHVNTFTEMVQPTIDAPSTCKHSSDKPAVEPEDDPLQMASLKTQIVVLC